MQYRHHGSDGGGEGRVGYAREYDATREDGGGRRGAAGAVSPDEVKKRNARVVATGVGKDLLPSTLIKILSSVDVHVDGIYPYTPAEDARASPVDTVGFIVQYAHPRMAAQALLWFDNVDTGDGNVLSIRRWMDADGAVRPEEHLLCERATAPSPDPSPDPVPADENRTPTPDQGFTQRKRLWSEVRKIREEEYARRVAGEPMRTSIPEPGAARGGATSDGGGAEGGGGNGSACSDDDRRNGNATLLQHAHHRWTSGGNDDDAHAHRQNQLEPNDGCVNGWNRREGDGSGAWDASAQVDPGAFAHVRGLSEVTFKLMPQRDIAARKLFIGKLPKGNCGPERNVTLEDLCLYFVPKYGPIAAACLVRHRQSGGLCGYAFVVFEHEDSLDHILADGNIHYIRNAVNATIEADCKRANGRAVVLQGASSPNRSGSSDAARDHQKENDRRHEAYGYGNAGARRGNSGSRNGDQHVPGIETYRSGREKHASKRKRGPNWKRRKNSPQLCKGGEDAGTNAEQTRDAAVPAAIEAIEHQQTMTQTQNALTSADENLHSI